MSESEIVTEADRLKTLIDQWHFDAFHGSIVARDVEVWNFVRAAAEDLKQRLIAALSASAP